MNDTTICRHYEGMTSDEFDALLEQQYYEAWAVETCEYCGVPNGDHEPDVDEDGRTTRGCPTCPDHGSTFEDGGCIDCALEVVEHFLPLAFALAVYGGPVA